MAKILELEAGAGSHISSVCQKAVEKAEATGEPVHFVFNDIHVTAEPGDSADALEARWTSDYESAAKAWRESPEYAARQAKREDDDKKARAAHMTESANTEKELREANVPWPLTKEQLSEYVESLVSKSHDYGTCVYAMSMAAEAAFNYIAGSLGASGFQASCADLDFIRRTRRIEGPFILIKAEDALYPQYDLPSKLSEAMKEWEPWLKQQAQNKLGQTEHAHPDVIRHWETLAQ